MKKKLKLAMAILFCGIILSSFVIGSATFAEEHDPPWLDGYRITHKY